MCSLYYGSERFISYSVDYRDYPQAVGPEEIPKLFGKIRDNRMLGLDHKIQVVSEQQTRVDGFPALLLETEHMGTRRLRELHVISGRRHYTILIITFSNHGENTMGAENAYEKIGTAFLDSFHVISATQ